MTAHCGNIAYTAHDGMERERAMNAVDDRLIFLDKIFLWIFCKNVYYIEILVNFALDSDEEEAEAASQNQHLLMVDFCPLKRYIN